ncbi:MAG: DUF2569 family protein [Candidatus Omnitrophota bacterium]
MNSKACPKCKEKNNPALSICWKCKSDLNTGEIAPMTQQTTKTYAGVDGWLLFFCISLTMLSPIGIIRDIAGLYSNTSQLFGQFPRFLVVCVILTFLNLVIMAFSIYAGVGLWKIKAGAVQMAKRYLLFSIGCNVVGAILPFMGGLPEEANKAMLQPTFISLFQTGVYVIVWYTYLKDSVRVKATYQL